MCADLGVASDANDAELQTGFPLGNQPVSVAGARVSGWFRHATAVPYNDQQARSAGLAGGSE